MSSEPPPIFGPAALDLAGKVAVVTGGATGIGAGCARVLASAGVDVVILDRDAAKGAATAERVTSEGPGRCRLEVVDVGDLAGLASVIRDVADRAGRLDILVNNAAMFPGWRAIDDVDDAVVLEALRVNVAAYVAGSRAALPYLRRQRGCIVNISSISGELGGWRDAVYSATKGAITSFTRGLAQEEAAHGVRVNAVLPGNILTEARVRSEQSSARPEEFHAYLERWQWMSRSGAVEEVGNAVLFLASPLASFSTGIGLTVSGGLELGFGVKEPYPDFGAR